MLFLMYYKFLYTVVVFLVYGKNKWVNEWMNEWMNELTWRLRIRGVLGQQQPPREYLNF